MIPYGASANYFSNPTGPYFTGGTSRGYSLTANPNSLPQITTPSGTGTISRINLNYAVPSGAMNGIDIMDIRVNGSNLGYSSGDAISWNGQGTLPYAITNFTVNNPGEYYYGLPFFAASGTVGMPSSGGFRVMVSSAPSALVPEPQEYALVFGLFALGFVIVRRRMIQKRRQQQQAATAS